MSRIIANNIRHNDATSDNLALDSSGRVGIGSSPTRPLTVAAGSGETVNILGVFDSSDANPSTVSNCVIAFSDPTSTGGQFSTRLGSVGDSLAFYTNGANERMRILSGGGLTFNGDTAAANALDDYEEGTWTPTINSGYTSITYNNQNGWYTKVGRLVVVSARVQFSGTSNSTYIQVGSLPFTAADLGGGAYGGGGIPYATVSEITNTSPYVGGNTSYVIFHTLGTGSLITSSTNASSKWISFVVSYSV